MQRKNKLKSAQAERAKKEPEEKELAKTSLTLG